jgi:hypothetical protein
MPEVRLQLNAPGLTTVHGAVLLFAALLALLQLKGNGYRLLFDANAPGLTLSLAICVFACASAAQGQRLQPAT